MRERSMVRSSVTAFGEMSLLAVAAAQVIEGRYSD